MEQINSLVSVIIVTRNRKNLLERAVNSVLAQTYNNFELIVIDGASEDGTDTLFESIFDKRVIYIRQSENIDPRLSIDIAFQRSKGEFICFLDDDDEYLPNKIQKQVESFKNLPNEFGLVYCWAEYFDNSNNSVTRLIDSTVRGYIFLEQIERQSIGGTPCIMIRRDVFKEFDGWNKKLKYVADWEFITRISRKYKIEVVPEILVRVHVNHSYERQSKAQLETTDRNKVANLLEFHTYYLEEFRDGYLLRPKAAIPHYLSAIRFSILLQEIFEALNLSKRLLISNVFNPKVIIQIIKVWTVTLKGRNSLKKPH